ncbi:MAG: type II secretion system protein [Clostridia bacterium]|nr:type II secretion system protein [Clostridia bacterium]
MRNTNKKGFTIVELVIVVAVIAILAAVLIPTFSGIIAKANLSADQQAVRNMNTSLATYIGTEKEISDVMSHLRSFGFSYEKMVTYSKGYHYCYAKSTNQMYLLDANNNVVYPENAEISKSELWAAYKDHATYIIPGINNYYAISAITSQVEFDAAFGNGTFVLDLNKNVCTVNGNANVTVKNGAVTGSGFKGTEGTITVSESNENNTVKVTDDAGKTTKITYTNVLNPVGVESGTGAKHSDGCIVEYVNCVFTKEPGFYQNGQSLNLVFKNCTFVNYGTFGIRLQPGDADGKTSTVTVDGCEFINCDRGILIGGWENTTVNITNCTFALKTGVSSNNCIQIANYASDADLASLKLNFTNNTVASANGVVYFHDSMTGPQNLETFKGTLNFSGNTFAKDVVLIVDRGEYKNGHFLYNNNTAMSALEALIK